ncbi:MAG: ferritin-like domain-containing protein [Synechococcaceae cyanobacterium]|nr:ferritin-like domain-containing protein [Synechococcaceae cyanobacterium]
MDAVHPRVLADLGRALSLELSAVQQYMFQASLVDSWGDRESADRFRHETVEEMQHAERIVQHMLTLGVAPSSSQLRPVTHAPDLVGLLRRNALLETDLVEHYAQAMRFCALIGDAASEAFFRELWKEERHHGEELTRWLESLGAGRERERLRATL